jgi:hypothetical protein
MYIFDNVVSYHLKTFNKILPKDIPHKNLILIEGPFQGYDLSNIIIFVSFLYLFIIYIGCLLVWFYYKYDETLNRRGFTVILSLYYVSGYEYMYWLITFPGIFFVLFIEYLKMYYLAE